MIKSTDILSRHEIRSLRTHSRIRGPLLVLHAWAVILAMMAFYIMVPHPLVLLLGVFVIGARQLGLAILMHDASHGLLTPDRAVNDWLGHWLCALPVGLVLSDYRPYHMRHHRFTQQDNDPDLSLSKPFPITKASLARKILRDLSGLTFLRLRTLQIIAAWGPRDLSLAAHMRRFWHGFGQIILVNVLIWAILDMAGYGSLYFLLWLLPLATANQLVARIRNIAEHAVVPDDKDDFKNARTTFTNPLTRAFIAPYWVNYHVEHHLFVYVPCYNLPRAHQILQQKGLTERMEMKPGYLSVLKAATQG